MRRFPSLLLLFLAISALLLMVARSRETNAQNPCPPAVYDSSVAPWAPGTQVPFSIDPSGAQTSVATNPQPKFTLDASSQTSFSTGMTNWNAHADQNGSNVTFQQGATGGPFNHIVTVAWPKANVTYTDSAGHTHTQTVDASDREAGTLAATFYIPDHNSSNQVMGTAAAAVTLINTNGSYTVNNVNYPVWDPAVSGFSSALEKVAGHETGHGFGLGHQADCGNVMSNPRATASNPTGGTNDSGGCTTSNITPCDDQEVLNNPNNLYNNPPPPVCEIDQDCPYGYTCNPATGYCEENPSGGNGGCIIDSDCTCGGICMRNGECLYAVDCSPILIPVGQNAEIRLTSARAGVWFDLDGDGKIDRVAWTRLGDTIAFLVRDVNGNGRIDDGTELFGNHTVLRSGQLAANGFDALADQDRPENGGNADGLIDSRDAIWPELRLWVDWNHNGVSEPIELYRLDEFQVTGISAVPRTTNRADAYGNVLRLQAPCQVGGKLRFGYDVYFSARPQRRPD